MSSPFLIDLSGLSDFTPQEFLGSSALLKMDGLYAVTIAKMTPGKSSTGNAKVLVSLTVLDADEKGATLLKDVPLSGKDKNDNPNIRQFGQLLLSAGLTTEQIQGLASKGQQAIEGFTSLLVGKTCFINAEAETYNGNTRSNVRGFVVRQSYDDAVAANAHRKPRRETQSLVTGPMPIAPGAATGHGAALPQMPAIGVAQVPAANGGGNPLSALSALGLNL